MLFRRRTTPRWHEKARIWLWPRRSFVRSSRYFAKRVVRVNATPYAIAAGAACGAFASFTPLIGLHFLIALGLAYAVRGNLIASAFGTAVGNPLTFPFIWASTYRVGRAVLGEPVLRDAEPTLNAPSAYTLDALSGFLERTWPVIKPMLVGSVPLGLTAAVICYGATYATVIGYQRAKDAKLRGALEDAARSQDSGSALAVEADGSTTPQHQARPPHDHRSWQ